LLEPVKNCATSHQAITPFKNHWCLVYHNGALPTGDNHRRSVCIEEFTDNSDGSIAQLTSSTAGVQKAITNLNPYQRVEAETIAWSEGLTAIDDEKTGVSISSIHDGDYIKLRSVDFGKKGSRSFEASVASV